MHFMQSNSTSCIVILNYFKTISQPNAAGWEAHVPSSPSSQLYCWLNFGDMDICLFLWREAGTRSIPPPSSPLRGGKVGMASQTDRLWKNPSVSTALPHDFGGGATGTFLSHRQHLLRFLSEASETSTTPFFSPI